MVGWRWMVFSVLFSVGPEYEAFCAPLSALADEVLQPVVEEPFVWKPRLF